MALNLSLLLLAVAALCSVSAFPPAPAGGVAQQTTSNTERETCCSESISGAVNDFSFKLVEETAGDGNYFISPLSISVALAMTYLGSRGQTAVQMENTLGFEEHNLVNTEVHEGFKEIISNIALGNDEYSLLLANAMYLQQNFTVKPEYVRDIREYYRSGVKNVDFLGNGAGAVQEINSWVADNTNNKISKLFNSPLDPLTRLVLLNAVYFKGTWKMQFPRDRTFDGTFYKGNGLEKQVRLMHLQKVSLPYFQDPDTRYKFVKLPYKGEHIVMLLALPVNYAQQADLRMTSDLLCRINENLKVTELEDVIVPKFRMEHEQQLKGALTALGMRDLFTEGVANLTGIREQNDLFVSSVLHKAVIEVNEEGSEAAAVTGVVIMTLSLNINPTFVANHPFQLYIIDERNGLILFSGRVADP